MAQTGDKPQKLCFVTIGATASFDALIRASLDREFLSELSKAGYRELQIQYGKDGRPLFEQLVSENASAKELGMKFTGFDFDADGLEEYFGDARNSEGVVVSHAGSGSILDALRINAPLIVVPNPKLLDNHQVELAEELALQGYVVHGKLDNLAPAIAESEALRMRRKEWPPVNSGVHRQAQGLQGVIDEELGFLD